MSLARRPHLAWLAVVAALAAVAAGWEAGWLWRFFLAHEGPPRWDPAGHGWLGVELLRDLQAGDPLRFLLDLNAQDKWPFGYSLALVPFLLAGGSSFASATLLSTVLWVAVAPLLVWVAWEVERGAAGLAAGALAAALWITSPTMQVLAIQVLRELGGIAVLLAAVGLTVRAYRRGTLGAWRLAGLATLGLILIKSNYALMWVIALGCDAILRRPAGERWSWVRPTLARLDPRGPTKGGAHKAVVTLAALATLSLLAGINPGLVVWLALVVVAVEAVRRARRGELALRRRLAALPIRARAIVETVALPIGVWWLCPYPNHPPTVFTYFLSRTGGSERAPLDVLHYVKSFPYDYAARPEIGWPVLALAAAGLALAAVRLWPGRRSGDEPAGRRFLPLTAAVFFALASLHPHKEIRYVALAIPLLMLTAAVAAGRAVLGERPGRARLAAGLAAVGLALAAVATAGAPSLGPDNPWLAANFPLYSGPPALVPALDHLAAAVGPGGRVGVAGTFDELSVDLVRWRLVQRWGVRAPEVVALPRRFDSGLPWAERRDRLERWIAGRGLDRVLALELRPDSAFARRDDYAHNAWQRAAVEVLARETAPRGPPRDFPDLGLTVTVYAVGANGPINPD